MTVNHGIRCILFLTWMWMWCIKMFQLWMRLIFSDWLHFLIWFQLTCQCYSMFSILSIFSFILTSYTWTFLGFIIYLFLIVLSCLNLISMRRRSRTCEWKGQESVRWSVILDLGLIVISIDVSSIECRQYNWGQ